MQVAVVGTGFVGVVTAGVFARFGNSVVAIDVDEEKIKLLKSGKVPFYEPNLKELIRDNLKAGRLSFTPEFKRAVEKSEVVFICVGTPSAEDGQADLSYIFSAARSISPYLQAGSIVVIKSTVPPSTNSKVQKIIKEKCKNKFYLASAPEFLKEGSAVADSLNPERVIIGSASKNVTEKLLDLHKPIKGKKIVMSPESAQLTKYAANAYLAARITFINEIADLCKKTGADVEEVIAGLGADRRIGSHYWYPGPGYGGSCFPKDVKELSAFAKSIGEGDGLFEKIDQLNVERIPKLMAEFDRQIGGFENKRVAVLGLSFKPNTDDMREAPSRKFIPRLLGRGAKITAYDPKAIKAAKEIFADKIEYADSAYQAVRGADLLLILVEWDEFQQLNLKKIKELMKGRDFIDTRNLYDPNKVKKQGFKYQGIGR